MSRSQRNICLACAAICAFFALGVLIAQYRAVEKARYIEIDEPLTYDGPIRDIRGRG